MTPQRLGLVEALDAGAEKLGVSRQMTGARFGHEFLLKDGVVERILAWITRWRRLARDHKGLPQSSEAFIKVAASRRMLSLVAPSFP